jgi:hypothetical protein
VKFQYQLVLQLPASSIKDYDVLIQIEESIIAGIDTLGEVDGHDMGAGEVNIFIDTDHPTLTFEKIKSLLGTNDFMPEVKVAYRDVDKDDYIVLYPSDLGHFSIA